MRKLTRGQSFFLDAVRYLAALMVAFHHGTAYFYRDAYNPISQAHYYTNPGSLGVSIFFVLSGFLIAYTVITKSAGPGGYSFRLYAIERVVRIYLVFAPALALAIFMNVINILFARNHIPAMDHFTLLNVAATATMMSDIAVPDAVFLFMGPAWTINYEFWLYAAFGFLTLPLSPLVLRVAGLVCVSALLWRLPQVLQLGALWAAGATFAYFFVYARPRIMAMLAAAALCAWFVFRGSEDVTTTVTEVVLMVTIFAGIHACRAIDAAGPLAVAVKRCAGFSYSLYLTHTPVIWAFRHLGIRTELLNLEDYTVGRFAWYAAAMVAANVFALFFAKLTEDNTAPVRRYLIERLGGSQRRSAVVT
ncbi:MAG: acyltransferase [Pseudolabrys sp.]|nr:acyltransferase [Pseudolabrys sp.]